MKLRKKMILDEKRDVFFGLSISTYLFALSNNTLIKLSFLFYFQISTNATPLMNPQPSPYSGRENIFTHKNCIFSKSLKNHKHYCT